MEHKDRIEHSVREALFPVHGFEEYIEPAVVLVPEENRPGLGEDTQVEERKKQEDQNEEERDRTKQWREARRTSATVRVTYIGGIKQRTE